MGHSGLWDLASGGSQRLFKARTKRPLNLIEVASGHNNNDRSYRKKKHYIVSIRNNSQNGYEWIQFKCEEKKILSDTQ